MFVPLVHPPGQAQADFGEAQVIIDGVLSKAHDLVVGLPYSDAFYVQAYLGETTEAFCDGHNWAFSFFGGVPQTVLYDNTKLAVARILGDGKRRLTRVFSEVLSHYLLDSRFGRPGKGNDKGKVENLVGYVRRNLFVPIPAFESFQALNAYLDAQCRQRLELVRPRHTLTIGQQLEQERETLLELPLTPYDASNKQAGRVSSLSLVRYQGNDYSVPVAYGHPLDSMAGVRS
jgi:transposase